MENRAQNWLSRQQSLRRSRLRLRPFVGAVERYDEEYDLYKVVYEDSLMPKSRPTKNFRVCLRKKATPRPRDRARPSRRLGFRAEITAPSHEEEEVTWLWHELETMRSKRDLSVIELTHLERGGTTP